MNIQITYSDDDTLNNGLQEAIFHDMDAIERRVGDKVHIGFSVDFTPPLNQVDIFIFILSNNLGKEIKAPRVESIPLIKYWFHRAIENEQAIVMLYYVSDASISKKAKSEIEEFLTNDAAGYPAHTCSDLTELINRLPDDILGSVTTSKVRRTNMPFDDYVTEQLEVHNLPAEVKDPYAFLRLEVLIHSAMLQRQKGIVDRDLLYRLVGSTRVENIKLALSDMKLKGFFKLFDNKRFLFEDQAFTAINRAFNASQYFYCVNEAVPFVKHKGELTGWDFLEYAFRLAPEVSVLDIHGASEIVTTILGHGFQELTGGKFEIPYPATHRNVGLLTGKDGNWSFLLTGYSNDKAMTLDDIKDCVYYVTPVKENLYEDKNLSKLKLLIIGPHIDDENAREDLAKDFRNVHFMWSITLLRLFHQLQVKNYLIPIIQANMMGLFGSSLVSGTRFIDWLDEKHNAAK